MVVVILYIKKMASEAFLVRLNLNYCDAILMQKNDRLYIFMCSRYLFA